MHVIHSERSESVEQRTSLQGVISLGGDCGITGARITEPKTRKETDQGTREVDFEKPKR